MHTPEQRILAYLHEQMPAYRWIIKVGNEGIDQFDETLRIAAKRDGGYYLFRMTGWEFVTLKEIADSALAYVQAQEQQHTPLIPLFSRLEVT